MNKVILMGRLTRDAEIRYSQVESSTAIARFSLAVDRRFRRDNDEQTADFINCVAFNKNSPYRDRSVEENLDLFERMKNGEFPDGSKVLRAKIDMASP